jgi:hypothetical protein
MAWQNKAYQILLMDHKYGKRLLTSPTISFKKALKLDIFSQLADFNIPGVHSKIQFIGICYYFYTSMILKN